MTCRKCSGPMVYMGVLGGLDHYRCRNCGSEESGPAISESMLMEAACRDDATGVCLRCGSEQTGVEPDATGYQCEACGEFAVDGVEQILISRSL